MFSQTTIIGNVGSDPAERQTPSGITVTAFSVAVNRKWTDANGEKAERTTWFRVTAWRKLGEFAGRYLKKGDRVLVVGEIEPATVYTAKDGTHRASLELTARHIQFVGGGNAPEEDTAQDNHSSLDNITLDSQESIPF